MKGEGPRSEFLEVAGNKGVSWAARGPTLTSNGPKVDVTFVLPNCEGHDVLRAIAVKMYGAQLLDALVGEYTYPVLCRASMGPQAQAFGPGLPSTFPWS